MAVVEEKKDLNRQASNNLITLPKIQSLKRNQHNHISTDFQNHSSNLSIYREAEIPLKISLDHNSYSPKYRAERKKLMEEKFMRIKQNKEFLEQEIINKSKEMREKEVKRVKKLREAASEQAEESKLKKQQMEEKLKKIQDKKEKERLFVEKVAYKDFRSHMDTVRQRHAEGSRSVLGKSSQLSPQKSTSTINTSLHQSFMTMQRDDPYTQERLEKFEQKIANSKYRHESELQLIQKRR